MKKIIILIGIMTMIIAAEVVFGQQPEGVITYEVRINVHRTLPPDQEGRKAMVPEFRIFKQQLFFNPGASLYKPLIEEEDDAGDGRGRRYRSRTEVYCDQNSAIVTTMQDFQGKNYLIDDTVRVDPWKLGTDTKMVQGYSCKMAYYTNEERKQTITAWYTDKLRPFLGPDRFNTLPGAVLAVDINNGERVFVATKIEMREVKSNELKQSTGQKITQAEYRKMVDERMKAMRNNGGFRN